MNMQILYLLAIGKFYTPEKLGSHPEFEYDVQCCFIHPFGQLNNALSNILDVNNWNFGTNFSTGERGWTDMSSRPCFRGNY